MWKRGRMSTRNSTYKIPDLPPEPMGISSSNNHIMFRLKGTVILRIWWQILLVVIYTLAIIAVHNYVDGVSLDFPMSLISVLGVVTGLLLVFRTNTAYDRYWEGRRLWSQMTLGIRNLARSIWVGVKEPSGREKVEKISAINLLMAFAVATKHYLREEYSYELPDIKYLIQHLPKFTVPSSNISLEDQKEEADNNGNREDDSNVNSIVNGSTGTNTNQDGEMRSSLGGSPENWGARKRGSDGSKGGSTKSKSTKIKAHDYPTPTNISIELSYYIASYIINVKERELVDASIVIVMNNALSSLVECLTGFERILRTPIPLAYSVHLHHATWLYLLALPYQLLGDLNWWTVVVVAFASFALLGILGIGWEIENPFGYDDNDLPLDDFCQVLKQEISMIMGHSIPPTEDWIFSSSNYPIAPEIELNALTLKDQNKKIIQNHLTLRASCMRETEFGTNDCLETVTVTGKSSNEIKTKVLKLNDGEENPNTQLL